LVAVAAAVAGVEKLAAAVAGAEKLVAAELVTICTGFHVNGGGGSDKNCWLSRVVSMFRSSLLVFMANGVTLKNTHYVNNGNGECSGTKHWLRWLLLCWCWLKSTNAEVLV
jgi:hypothetical protein